MNKLSNTPLQRTQRILSNAAMLARKEYSKVGRMHESIEDGFSGFEAKMNKMEEHLLKLGPCHKALADALRTVLDTRRAGVKACWKDWQALFTQLELDLDVFTVMLFGRTMSGKSTTLEALVGGDGSRIGDGIPDFTRTVDSIEWESAGLRIADTPGIEGFSPEILNTAEAFMDRADAVAFVISDDHIEPALLDRLLSIINRRKPIIVLLNMKLDSRKLQRNVKKPFGNCLISMRSRSGVMNSVRISGRASLTKSMSSRDEPNWTSNLPRTWSSNSLSSTLISTRGLWTGADSRQ